MLVMAREKSSESLLTSTLAAWKPANGLWTSLDRRGVELGLVALRLEKGIYQPEAIGLYRA
jgi:hypothetical protein